MPRFQVVSENDVEVLHRASLRILERVGVQFLDSEATEIMKAGGCTIEGSTVKIPPELVQESVESAPTCVTLHSREGEPTMRLEGRNTFFGPGSDCLYVIDHRTRERRKARLADVAQAARVADHLPNIDFFMSMFYPWDVDEEVVDRHQMETMLLNTQKPIVFVTLSVPGCVDAVQMAEVVAGGPERLRRHPSVACYVNVTTPLRHNAEALQKVLFLANKGLPFVYVPAVRRGLTSPMTVAGSVALNNAGQLAGVVLSQLVRKGTPIIICGGGAVQTIDMKTLGSAYAAPDSRLMEAALARYYRLPRWGLAGCSDSKTVDEQAAIEAALTLLVDAANDLHLIHDLGYLEGGQTGSLEMLAMCDEIVGWIKRLLHPPDVSEEALALDLIEQVGPDGQFLDAEHTYRHVAEDWYPTLMERHTYEVWKERGGQTMRERAAETVTEILGEHTPPPLPSEVRAQIADVRSRASRDRVG